MKPGPVMSWFATRRCPSEATLTTALSDGGPESVLGHVATCPRCAKLTDDIEQLRILGRQVPVPTPGARQMEQIRTSILASLAARPQGLPSRVGRAQEAGRWRWRLVAVVATAAVAIGAGTALRSRGERGAARTRAVGAVVETFHASVYPRPGAQLDCEGDRRDDTVRLRDGGARFDVSPLGPGERFRVLAGDAEVEVRGTSFDVEVHRERLLAVRVHHGRVEVRPAGRPAAVLSAGDRWDAPMPPADEAGSSPAERAFVAAWAAFRRQDFTAAIAHFDQMLSLESDNAMAEDAEYWRAIAFARARLPAASAELGTFLRKYPRSEHAEDAMTALARLRATLARKAPSGGAAAR